MIKLIFATIFFVFIATLIYFGVQSLHRASNETKLKTVKYVLVGFGIICLGSFLLFSFVSLF